MAIELGTPGLSPALWGQGLVSLGHPSPLCFAQKQVVGIIVEKSLRSLEAGVKDVTGVRSSRRPVHTTNAPPRDQKHRQPSRLLQCSNMEAFVSRDYCFLFQDPSQTFQGPSPVRSNVPNVPGSVPVGTDPGDVRA